ncbi:PREDICTED: protein TONNEAU 1a-like [Ipomoea nil]|uniref:protein TONNEAU 1a-like n=1 Tax=Ipomoea nil TaxID=35883 RepID=UPI000900BCFD|nr:PREDICTED: protein TONNEAU 1a-like [Ipomoea nil]
MCCTYMGIFFRLNLGQMSLRQLRRRIEQLKRMKACLPLLGSCNDRAKHLHNSPSGRLLTALVCEYLDWAQLNHTLKVYLPECNLQKDFWKSELKEFSSKNGYDLNMNGDSGPLLLDVLEGFLKYEVRYNTL